MFKSHILCIIFKRTMIISGVTSEKEDCNPEPHALLGFYILNILCNSILKI